MVEIWKPIKDYENLYEISNLGNIRSLDRQITLNSKNQFTTFKSIKNIKGKMIKQCINQSGYYQVLLYKNGNKKNYLVHRLIAETFIPNPDNKPTINHINGNTLDNSLNNLEWATMKEQIEHSVNVLKHKRTINDKCRKRQIELHQKKVKRSDGEIFESIKIASNGNEVLRRHISECCKGKIKSAGGYTWQYVGD